MVVIIFRQTINNPPVTANAHATADFLDKINGNSTIRDQRMPALTKKQEDFCLAYVKGATASDAYRRSYSASGMKDKTINEKSCILLADGKIRARVDELKDRIATTVVIVEARILEEVARIALLDPAKLFDSSGKLLPIHLMLPEVRATIAAFDVDDAGLMTKVKLCDKNSALEKLMKHLGSFEKDNNQRAGAFDNVPAETLRMIEDKLRGMGAPGAIPADRFAH